MARPACRCALRRDGLIDQSRRGLPERGLHARKKSGDGVKRRGTRLIQGNGRTTVEGGGITRVGGGPVSRPSFGARLVILSGRLSKRWESGAACRTWAAVLPVLPGRLWVSRSVFSDLGWGPPENDPGVILHCTCGD